MFTVTENGYWTSSQWCQRPKPKTTSHGGGRNASVACQGWTGSEYLKCTPTNRHVCQTCFLWGYDACVSQASNNRARLFFLCLKSVSSWRTVFIILLTNGKLLVLFECKSAGISWQNSLGNITAFSTIIMSATAVFLHLFTPGKVTTFFNTKIIFLAAVCLHLFTPATGESYRFLT